MRLHAVVVAYRPDMPALTSLCEALGRNGSAVVVVDNTDDPSLERFTPPAECTLIALGRNAGVAEAFNVGIRHALEAGAEVVVLFDQDSEVPDGFLARLVRPLCAGTAGVTAPLVRSRATGVEYPARRIGRWGQSVAVRAGDAEGAEPVPVDIVISSGCAATAAAIAEVGLMDERLFIDFVDVDWCLRCRASGVPVMVVPDAVMEHAIGERVVRAPFGMYRGIVHGPVRTYYKIRNALLMAGRPHVPPLFAVHQAMSALIHNMIQLAFVRERGLYLRTYVAAVSDGVRGITGKRREGSHE